MFRPGSELEEAGIPQESNYGRSEIKSIVKAAGCSKPDVQTITPGPTTVVRS